MAYVITVAAWVISEILLPPASLTLNTGVQDYVHRPIDRPRRVRDRTRTGASFAREGQSRDAYRGCCRPWRRL